MNKTSVAYKKPSARAELITRRTYNRPKDAEGKIFETWEETIDRVIQHQRWLWERAKKGVALTNAELDELEYLREIMLKRIASVSGRTLWLGGTTVAQSREASQFNCSFLRVETVHDVVDADWLLLQGCGVGFEPVRGVLNGFAKTARIEVKRSLNKDRGEPNNKELFYTRENGERVWELCIGDSAEAWAKSSGKLLAMKKPVDVIILNFEEVRRAGQRLKGYGWICSGDETIVDAYTKICELLNKRAGKLLSRMDILDILNLLGTTLSSRRSAEIALVPVDDPETDEFILAKKDFWLHGNEHRQQSNNSIMFHKKPTRWELAYIFQRMQEAGGSEPGFINAEAAKKRAPWFKGVNP